MGRQSDKEYAGMMAQTMPAVMRFTACVISTVSRGEACVQVRVRKGQQHCEQLAAPPGWYGQEER